jgi:hypothetical protein
MPEPFRAAVGVVMPVILYGAARLQSKKMGVNQSFPRDDNPSTSGSKPNPQDLYGRHTFIRRH